jgi:acyl transferase domain-containing protein
LARNLREPVLFYAALKQLLADGNSTFVEISPHPILLAPIEGVLHEEHKPGPAVPSLHRDRGEGEVMLGSLGALYASGREIDWRRLYPRGRLMPLPAYPWQRKRFWIEGKALSVSEAPATAGDPETAKPQRYRIEWRVHEKTTPAATIRARWLVLATGGGLGRALAARLAGHGGECAHLDAGDRESLETWIAKSADAAHRHTIIDLRALDLPQLDGSMPSGTEDVLRRGCLDAVQLLNSLPESVPIRVWTVTRGVQVVGEQALPPSVAASPLWGLARVAALERPDVWGGIIDLDPAVPRDEVERLAETLLAPDEDDQLALRGGQRFVPRLVPVRPTGTATIPWKSEGSYLITGGLGGVGLRVARWAAERGARHLVLTGRTGLPARKDWDTVSGSTPEGRRIAQLKVIESLGARVVVVAADSVCNSIGRFGSPTGVSRPRTSHKGNGSGWHSSPRTWKIAPSMSLTNGPPIRIRSTRKSFAANCCQS